MFITETTRRHVGFITCSPADSTARDLRSLSVKVLEHLQDLGFGWVIWGWFVEDGAHSRLGAVQKKRKFSGHLNRA